MPRASEQDGSYPRPQMMRDRWVGLDGTWSFRRGDGTEGHAWAGGFDEGRPIQVPFAPESKASGIGDDGYLRVAWYSRELTAADLGKVVPGAPGDRVLLHFGAVDYRATVWLDGALVGTHEGGHTPFSLDVTDRLSGAEDGTHLLVVRAEDDPHDVAQPRGKQDWHEQPHAIWYRRTTGIWQTVWLEAVPSRFIEYLRWTNVDHQSVRLSLRLSGERRANHTVTVRLERDGEGTVAQVSTRVADHTDTLEIDIPIACQQNGQAEDELTWTPETPRLIDATISVYDETGEGVDEVSSYLGLRTTGTGNGWFLLNDRPYYVRSVLEQGYWPQSHLTAPSPAHLRAEVELIKRLGFNAVRIHQKIEDPRFMFWADRLGLLVWGEAPSAYAFSPLAMQRFTREWMDAVARDASHPCIVTWVPTNESWGIQHVSTDPAQQAYARALADITRALDPTRPVISNDGWEHQNSDIVSIHDYEGRGDALARRYADEHAFRELLRGMGPAGRRILLDNGSYQNQPVMLTEFGGIDFQQGKRRAQSWGYTAAVDQNDWLARVRQLYDAIRASAILVGSCYTQLTDTLQETNGLCDEHRRPKAPVDQIREAITGESAQRAAG